MVSFNFVVINGLAITTLASALPASQFPVIPKQMISREVRQQSKKRDHDHVHAHDDHHHHHHHHHHHGRDHHHHHHHHDHDHKHHHRSYETAYLLGSGNSHNSHPLIKVSLTAYEHDHLVSRGLLDALADPLAALGPILGTLVPILKGLPIIGGFVDIAGPIVSGLLGDKLGSLLLGPSPNAASISAFTDPSALKNTTYPIVASKTSHTPMFLVSLNYTLDPAVTGNASIVPVTMAIPVMGESSLAVLCATYETTPSAAAPLTAQPCTNTTTAPINTSQVFAFNPDTGTVHPLWSTLAEPIASAPNTTAGGANDAPTTQSITLVFQGQEKTTDMSSATNSFHPTQGSDAPSDDSDVVDDGDDDNEDDGEDEGDDEDEDTPETEAPQAAA